jgi:hypothetical protein
MKHRHAHEGAAPISERGVDRAFHLLFERDGLRERLYTKRNRCVCHINEERAFSRNLADPGGEESVLALNLSQSVFPCAYRRRSLELSKENGGAWNGMLQKPQKFFTRVELANYSHLLRTRGA